MITLLAFELRRRFGWAPSRTIRRTPGLRNIFHWILMRSMADRLFLIEPGFEDPDYSQSTPEGGTLYLCPACLPLEGLIALYSQALAGLDVVRVPFNRPRHDVVAVFGEENQTLPKLLLHTAG
jgi:hypothetical protein